MATIIETEVRVNAVHLEGLVRFFVLWLIVVIKYIII